MDELQEWIPESWEAPTNELQQDRSTPVVLDFGSSVTRVGVASASRPSHEFLTKAARYRDRKSGEQRTVVGNDLLLDVGSKSSVRSPFDGPLLTNWDPAECVLDYGLGLVGFDANKPSPIAISEALLVPHMSHRTLQELLFEGYAAPKVAFAPDVLAAARYTTTPHNNQQQNNQQQGNNEGNELLVYLGAEATHIVPVIAGKPQLADTRRIRFGSRSAAEYLHNLLILKYPTFPVPVSPGEVEQMLRRHCFAALDYKDTVRKMMDVDFLTNFQVRIQAPFPPEPARDVEQEQRQAERRKESGRRLQEQAAVARAERQEKQQQQVDELKQWESQLAGVEREDAESQARAYGFKDLVDLRRTIRQLDNGLKRSRGEVVEDPEPSTPLLVVPDEELSADQIKDKRRQKLLRASYDARQRARAVKEAQRQQAEAAEAAEAEWRTRDLQGWAAEKRAKLDELLNIIREREKIKNDPRLRFRHTLMEGLPAKRPKREVKEEDGDEELLEEEEEEPDYDGEADVLKALLLEHDPQFSLEALGPQRSWQNSSVHKFLWGAQPYDVDNVRQNHQLNLNIERVRAVEPLFQPSMVGLDQAGLSEVCAELLKKYPILTSNVQLSGGFASIRGLADRLSADLRRELPVTVAVAVQATDEPQLDAWRGLAQLSSDNSAYVTRQEYDEKGPDYVKE